MQSQYTGSVFNKHKSVQEKKQKKGKFFFQKAKELANVQKNPRNLAALIFKGCKWRSPLIKSLQD